MDNDIHYKKKKSHSYNDRESWAPWPRGQMCIALSNVE